MPAAVLHCRLHRKISFDSQFVNRLDHNAEVVTQYLTQSLIDLRGFAFLMVIITVTTDRVVIINVAGHSVH